MATVHAEFLRHFYMGEDDVVLVAADHDGIDQLIGALRHAGEPGASGLRLARQTHTFLIEEGAATVEFRNGDVVWRLSGQLIEEVAGKLESMKRHNGSCHHYVDISEPASILLLSRDEYPERLE